MVYFLYSKPFISRPIQTLLKEECDNNYDESMFEDALKEVWPELYQQLKNIDDAENILECLIALRTAIHLLEVYDKGGREALEALRFGKS